jgi:hypothetical protein
MPNKIQAFRSAMAAHYADITEPSASSSEPNWGETALAISATAIAVVVVAFIAVLMGLA